MEPQEQVDIQVVNQAIQVVNQDANQDQIYSKPAFMLAPVVPPASRHIKVVKEPPKFWGDEVQDPSIINKVLFQATQDFLHTQILGEAWIELQRIVITVDMLLGGAALSWWRGFIKSQPDAWHVVIILLKLRQDIMSHIKTTIQDQDTGETLDFESNKSGLYTAIQHHVYLEEPAVLHEATKIAGTKYKMTKEATATQGSSSDNQQSRSQGAAATSNRDQPTAMKIALTYCAMYPLWKIWTDQEDSLPRDRGKPYDLIYNTAW